MPWPKDMAVERMVSGAIDRKARGGSLFTNFTTTAEFLLCRN